MVLEAGSNPIETIKHPGALETMLKTVLYPKDFDSISGWIPDVGDGSVLKEPKEERLADPGSRGEDSDGVEGEDESESEKRGGVPCLRERLPMSAGLGVGELRARNTIERVARAAIHGFEKRVLQYNNVVENNSGCWNNISNKAAKATAAEERRHNLEMEKQARGSGVADVLGTVKEFGKRFGEETKKTVK
ncbi:hypothetical protein LOTGIDRAFT_157255 [Lottia gigantea]|uniref:Uncharacterized protein n=1 Tax=Lottia gigantea TaxID=225164 RepID=V4B8K2_LOTGI|nr:hypothetical protein LOTGIDRAFT_157255 [Lottia gigantea]ESP02107.1 hypothetical protein LOTGIDRAFT_157255 [Lottia gigantea]